MFVFDPQLPKRENYVEVIDENGNHVYKQIKEQEISPDIENLEKEVKELEDVVDILMEGLV